jgi:signal transduction histidine kinase
LRIFYARQGTLHFARRLISMSNALSPGTEHDRAAPAALRAVRYGLFFAAGIILFSVATSVLLPRGYALAACGDTLQLLLIAATTVFAFQNFLRGRFRVRIFWFLIFLGTAIWTLSNGIWAFYELLLRRPVPSSPVVDVLLFVMIVPLTASFAAAPHVERRSPFRAFGLLDVSVLMVYALYLYALGVYSYLLVPGAVGEYNFRFDVAHAIGNHILMLATAIAVLVSPKAWKTLYRLFFLSAASYALATNIADPAIDMGRYYSGGVYDIPLIVALSCLLCVTLVGRTIEQKQPSNTAEEEPEELPGKTVFLSSHVAMLGVLSMPLIGVWLLTGPRFAPLLRFRMNITLITMLALGLLLSVKEDLLTAGLISSLGRLSQMYSSIERFKSQLSESEKMASLGALVADVANQIKQCMTVISDVAASLSARHTTETRVHNMAVKIGHYAHRTDTLCDNMLHFAQETPMRPTLLEIKPLLQSALQLSRIAKLPDVRVNLIEEGECPRVLADSSHLLHVFLELISNAIDALEEVRGGSFDIRLYRSDSQVMIEFADSGPGLKEPARVFEPFYTTKVVGKGTGLGLSTCYGILQQHQGEITCRNRLTGGAVFTVCLPIVQRERSENSPSGTVLIEGSR